MRYFTERGANEQAIWDELKRLGVAATEQDPTGVEVAYDNGNFRIYDDWADAKISGVCVADLLAALREIPAEDGGELFWETVIRFENDPARVEKDPAAVALGSKKSAKKAAASRENGKKGGRPRKDQQP